MGGLGSFSHDSEVIMEGRQRENAGDETEWEYEYEENETEDFYFTLDLTAHDCDALVSREKNPRVRYSRTREPVWAADQQAPTPKGRGRIKPPPQPIQEDDTATGSAPPDELQIVDLHSAQPFVRLNGGYYSCYWSTDLGTQVYVSKAGVVEDAQYQGHVVDVVGLSRARLLGKPVQLQERKRPSKPVTRGASAATAITGADEDRSNGNVPSEASEVLTMRPGQALVVPKERITDESTKAQASFLERLSAIKLKKGEKDFVPIIPISRYAGPPNKQEIRAKALAANSDGTVATPNERKRSLAEVDVSDAITTSQESLATILANGQDSLRSILPKPNAHTADTSNQSQASTTRAQMDVVEYGAPGVQPTSTAPGNYISPFDGAAEQPPADADKQRKDHEENMDVDDVPAENPETLGAAEGTTVVDGGGEESNAG
jgi:hypothetical protein